MGEFCNFQKGSSFAKQVGLQDEDGSYDSAMSMTHETQANCSVCNEVDSNDSKYHWNRREAWLLYELSFF